MDSVRSDFQAWASSMRPQSKMDDGGALSFKTQFVHFMKIVKHGRQVEDYKEVCKRLFEWDRTDRCVKELNGDGIEVSTGN